MYFVALIVLLRLLIVKYPMDYEDKHETIGRISTISIWSLALIVPSIIFIISLPDIYTLDVWVRGRVVAFQLLQTFPLLCTTIMYAILLYILKKKTDVSEATNKKKKSMAKMIQGVVICLVICNLPMMLWILWWGEMLKKGTEEAREVVFNTAFGVNNISKISF